MTYRVVDVSEWIVVADEPSGADPKDWLTPPGQEALPSREQWWLFKPVKMGKTTGYRRNDDRVERIASELTRLLDLPAAEVDLATHEGEEGCLSRYVISDGWSMASGDSMLNEYEGYVSCAANPRLRERSGHNLDNIAHLLTGDLGPPATSCAQWPAFDVFAGFLVFDAWIANTDRHAINWAVLYGVGDCRRLAPSFDHGSALGSGVQEDDIPADVARWCGRGMARQFEGGRKVSLVDYALGAVAKAGPSAQQWLDRLRQLDRAQWCAVLGEVPGLSDAHATFMDETLATNQRRLCS